jgi:hypothetical protein
MLESVGDRAVAASIHRRKVARAEPAIASALKAAQSIGRPRQLLLNLEKLDSHERPLVLSITDLRAVWPGCGGPSALRLLDRQVLIYLIADGRRAMQTFLSRRLLGG